jgi:hypothetical protein
MEIELGVRDLMFRTRLEAALAPLGPVRRWEGDAPPPAGSILVLDLAGYRDPEEASQRIRDLVAAGVHVLAFGPHRERTLLAAASSAGAVVVSNARLMQDPRHVVRGFVAALASEPDAQDAPQGSDDDGEEKAREGGRTEARVEDEGAEDQRQDEEGAPGQPPVDERPFAGGARRQEPAQGDGAPGDGDGGDA